jgi:radical SAM protein (TIGR01212 family)
MPEEKFNSLGRFLKQTFGEPVRRINVSIPGREPDPWNKEPGYALNLGGPLEPPPADAPLPPVEQQIREAKERIRQKYRFGKHIVHFRTGAGDSVNLATLREIIGNVMRDDEIIGFNITVRLNCFDDELVDFLADLSRHIYIWVETGLYTIHDVTLEKFGINISHSRQLELLETLMAKKLRVSAHFVLGLPGETQEMMRQTMEKASQMLIQGVNINHFYLLKYSPLVEEYRRGEIKLPEMNDYVSLAADFIELMPPHIVLRRIVGAARQEHLLAPEWTLLTNDVVNAITGELKKRNSFQGSKNPEWIHLAEKEPEKPVTQEAVRDE